MSKDVEPITQINSSATEPGILYSRGEFNRLLPLTLGGLIFGCRPPTGSRRSTAVNQQPVGGDTFINDLFKRVPEQWSKSDFKTAQNANIIGEILDPKYVGQLFGNLERPLPLSGEQKAGIINRNLRWLITFGGMSALKIDESGYYLTAAHGFFSISDNSLRTEPGLVYDPNTGLLNVITSFIIPQKYVEKDLTDMDKDIAVFFAPSGKSRQPVFGVSVDLQMPKDDEDLWMHSLSVEPGKEIIRGILHGNVDQNLRSFNGIDYPGMIKVRGMIPYGGSSGAPVIDSNGNVRGIESGLTTRSFEVNVRGNYTGATLVPINAVEELLNQSSVGNIQKLPISFPK